MRKLILTAVVLVAGSTGAFAQYGPGGSGYGPPPPDYDRRGPPPDFDRRPPPPGFDRGPPPRDYGYDRGPPRRCFFVDTQYGPRRVCRGGPPPRY